MGYLCMFTSCPRGNTLLSTAGPHSTLFSDADRNGDFNDSVEKEPQLSPQIVAFILFHDRNILDKMPLIHTLLVCHLS